MTTPLTEPDTLSLGTAWDAVKALENHLKSAGYELSNGAALRVWYLVLSSIKTIQIDSDDPDYVEDDRQF